MTVREWRILGVSLVLLGVTMVLWAAGTNAATLEALGVGFGIFGAAMVIRTIRPG